MDKKDFFRNIFPNRFLINLERRKDRLVSASGEFERMGVYNVARFAAIDSRKMDIKNIKKFIIKPGEMGCLLSHLSIYKYCLHNDIAEAVIFEDDVEFICEQDYDFLQQYKNIPSDWQMIMLGGNHISLGAGVEPMHKKIAGDIYKTEHAYALHSYIIKEDFMREVCNEIENLARIEKAIDVYIARVMKNQPTYFFNPVLTKQIEDFSDIQQTVTNYDNWLKMGI